MSRIYKRLLNSCNVEPVDIAEQLVASSESILGGAFEFRLNSVNHNPI